MRRLLVTALTLGALAAPSVASAHTTHCRSFVEHYTHADIAPLAADGASCAAAHQLAAAVGSDWALTGQISRLTGRWVGRNWQTWHVHARQVTSPAFEDPYALVTLTRRHATITFGLHG